MKRSLIAASVLVLALGTLVMPSSTAIAPAGGSYPWNCQGNGTAVAGGQMTYDSTTVTANTAVGDGLPGVMVCRHADNQYYVVMLGLYNAMSPGLTEAMGASYGAKTYTVTFPVQSGDTTTIADAIGTISEYSVTNGVARVVITPIEASTVFGDERPSGCNPPSDSNGNYKAECAENAVTGRASSSGKYARFSVRFDQGWSNLAGMYVSASADLFEVKLSGSCPASTSTGGFGDGSSGDGGANRPVGLRAGLETSLIVNLLGPHLTETGSLNQGSLSAVIPFATVQSCFGATPEEMAQNFTMTRTENGTTETASTSSSGGLRYTISPSQAGLVVSVPTVTFSTPTYTLKFAKPGSTDTAGGAAENTSSAGTIAGVKVKGAKGAAVATFKKTSTVKKYAVEAQLSSGKGAVKRGTCKVKGANVTCTVKKLKKGTWSMQITSTLKAGGAGPSATKTGIKVK